MTNDSRISRLCEYEPSPVYAASQRVEYLEGQRVCRKRAPFIVAREKNREEQGRRDSLTTWMSACHLGCSVRRRRKPLIALRSKYSGMACWEHLKPCASLPRWKLAWPITSGLLRNWCHCSDVRDLKKLSRAGLMQHSVSAPSASLRIPCSPSWPPCLGRKEPYRGFHQTRH